MVPITNLMSLNLSKFKGTIEDSMSNDKERMDYLESKSEIIKGYINPKYCRKMVFLIEKNAHTIADVQSLRDVIDEIIKKKYHKNR